jgi:hypothetical protein
MQKTKIIIFNKGGHKITKPKFVFDKEEMEKVQNYQYLGIVFNACGSFNVANLMLKDKGLKICFGLIARIKDCKADVGLKMFRSLINPIISYASEIWASYYFVNLNDNNLTDICDKPFTESVVIKFAIFLLGTHKRSSNCAVRGELGLYPALINQVTLMLKYWFRLSQIDDCTLVSKCYKECQALVSAGVPCWLTGIKRILSKYQMDSLWERVSYSPNSFKTKPNMQKLKTCMEIEYSRSWIDKISKPASNTQNGNKLRTYASFKKTFANSRMQKQKMCFY